MFTDNANKSTCKSFKDNIKNKGYDNKLFFTKLKFERIWYTYYYMIHKIFHAVLKEIRNAIKSSIFFYSHIVFCTP